MINLEGFECFTIESLVDEFNRYNKLLNKIERELLKGRNPTGSKAEVELITHTFDLINSSVEILIENVYDRQLILENIQHVVGNINDLKMRKYVSYINFET